MKERKQSEESKNKEWLEKSKKGGITDRNSPLYDGEAGYYLLEEILKSTVGDINVLTELIKSKDCTEICRRNAMRILTNLSEETGRDNTIDLINLLRKISDDKEDNEDVRVRAYEVYRGLKFRVFGGLSEEELTRERRLSEKETSLRMKWLRYMRD